MKSQEQRGIRHYLLGVAPQDEQPQLEERLLTDSAFYEELLIAEDDLIDEYLEGELSPSEQRNFEEHFLLTPERQKKLRFAGALKKYVAEKQTQKPFISPIPKWWHPSALLSSQNPFATVSVAIAMLLVVVAFLWVIRNPRPQGASGLAITVDLTPGLVRADGEIKRISIPSGTGTVNVRLALPTDEYPSYRAVVLTSQGTKIWSTDSVKTETLDGRKTIFLSLPADLLSPGDYQVRVSGQLPDAKFEAVTSYTFRVLRYTS